MDTKHRFLVAFFLCGSLCLGAPQRDQTFTSMEALKSYANVKGKPGDQYKLQEPNKPLKIVTLDEQIVKDVSQDQEARINEDQDTILDKVNNFNMKTYIHLSKSFRKVQDKVEDVAYASPLIGGVLGPLTSFANLLSGLVNEGNDKLMNGVYSGVRTVLRLNGSVVIPDYNHRPVDNRPLHKEHQVEETKKKIEALDLLKK